MDRPVCYLIIPSHMRLTTVHQTQAEMANAQQTKPAAQCKAAVVRSRVASFSTPTPHMSTGIAPRLSSLSRLRPATPAVLVELAVVAFPRLLDAHPLRGPEPIPDCQVARNLAQQEPVIRGLNHICKDLLGALVDVADLHKVE